MTAIIDRSVPVIADDDKYAGTALAIQLNYNLDPVLTHPDVVRGIGYGLTYPQAVVQLIPKQCALYVGEKIKHLKRIFANQP